MFLSCSFDVLLFLTCTDPDIRVYPVESWVLSHLIIAF